MMRRIVWIAVTLLVTGGLMSIGMATGPTSVAGAAETHTLRLATLAPRRSAWHRVFQAWKRSAERDSEGRLKLRFYYGGTQGDERDYIRKMSAGQLDGAAVTTTGLAQIVRRVLVLSAPGVFKEYEQIDRVRRALGDEIDGWFDESGYKLLGWGDVGRGRIFSRRPIRRPREFKRARPWSWRDNSVFAEFLRVVGARGQRLGVNEVLPALQTGRIDAFPASALAAASLQWFNHAKHVTVQTDTVLIGATVMKKERYDALPDDLKRVLDETSERAHRALQRRIRQADDRAYQAILKRGVKAVDIGAHQDEWDTAAAETRKRLAGRIYSADLLRRVEELAAR